MHTPLDPPYDPDAFDPRHYALVFGVCWLLWLLLAGAATPPEVTAGAVVAAVVTALFGKRFKIFNGFRFSWLAPWYISLFMGHFLVALVRANLDMARRVLSPSLPLRPHVIELRTRLKSPLGRFLLANSITLTPGTLTVDVLDDRMLIHWVDCADHLDVETATRQIAEPLEADLQRFLL